MPRRAGLRRAAISLYAKGMRAQEFPAPVARVTSESPIWDWYEMARWMCRTKSKIHPAGRFAGAWTGKPIC